MKKIFFFSFIFSFLIIYSVFPLFVGHTNEETVNNQLLKMGYPESSYIVSNGTVYYKNGHKAELNPPKLYSVTAFEAFNNAVNYVNLEYGEYFGMSFQIDINTLEETPEFWIYKFRFGGGSAHSGYVTINRVNGKVSLHALNEY